MAGNDFNQRVVGISEMVVSRDPDEVLVTYSLGSCIGVALYDAERRTGGLLHFMLPTSRSDQEKAKAKPCMFGDSGMELLLQGVFDLGARRRTLVATVAGGSSRLDESGLFKIGERNYGVVRKILWRNGIMIAGEEVGGLDSRTMRLFISTGKVTITTNGVERVLSS